MLIFAVVLCITLSSEMSIEKSGDRVASMMNLTMCGLTGLVGPICPCSTWDKRVSVNTVICVRRLERRRKGIKAWELEYSTDTYFQLLYCVIRNAVRAFNRHLHASFAWMKCGGGQEESD